MAYCHIRRQIYLYFDYSTIFSKISHFSQKRHSSTVLNKKSPAKNRAISIHTNRPKCKYLAFHLLYLTVQTHATALFHLLATRYGVLVWFSCIGGPDLFLLVFCLKGQFGHSFALFKRAKQGKTMPGKVLKTLPGIHCFIIWPAC